LDLKYWLLSPSDNLPDLDFTEDDGSDPLQIDYFYRHELNLYQENNLSKIWIVRMDSKPVGYLTISMNAIQVDYLSTKERIGKATTKKYPATLLGRMGVDKKYRKKGIGKKICKFCVGLVQDISDRIACRYVILETTVDKVTFYKNAEFIKSTKPPRHGKVWMYRRIV